MILKGLSVFNSRTPLISMRILSWDIWEDCVNVFNKFVCVCAVIRARHAYLLIARCGVDLCTTEMKRLTGMKTWRKRKDRKHLKAALTHMCFFSTLALFCSLFLFIPDLALSYCIALRQMQQQKHGNLKRFNCLYSDDSGIWLHVDVLDCWDFNARLDLCCLQKKKKISHH